MSQCDTCKFEEAPCDFNQINSAGRHKCDYYEQKKPRLERWIVPDGHEIMYEYKDHYHGHHKNSGCSYRWRRDNGMSLGIAPHLIPRHPDLKIDDPVIVWDDLNNPSEKKRHFAGWDFAGWDKEGKIKTWRDGATSWSVQYKCGTTTWDNYRLPTPEELKTKMKGENNE